MGFYRWNQGWFYFSSCCSPRIDGSCLGKGQLSKRFKKGTRTGFTTGACAAAAAAAASKALTNNKTPKTIATLLPNGQTVSFTVDSCNLGKNSATAVVIKDAGDDPDCTNGAHLTAKVEIVDDKPDSVTVHGGQGVGRITRIGVGLPVGAPAINPVPMANIIANVKQEGAKLLKNHGLRITISVPEGKMMAKKTLNHRLGIMDGISILGTGGIVYPYSTSAYKASIQQAVQVASKTGCDAIVFTTGRRTERYAMEQKPNLPEYSFIQMGDFFAAAMESAKINSIAHVVVAAMAGKLAKIGQGMDNTHAHKNRLDMDRVAALAKEAGGSTDICDTIAKTITVRHAAELLKEQGLEKEFYQLLVKDVAKSMSTRLDKKVKIEVIAFGLSGTPLANWEQ
ncbi:MAG: cobalt-precorrin-5B (C(1))-methyltransferase [Magnetococcales bacterium]|nr:cobalt-precorrin-5B (C(1))-methyltransferase [Magnetococcales bacterium]